MYIARGIFTSYCAEFGFSALCMGIFLFDEGGLSSESFVQ